MTYPPRQLQGITRTRNGRVGLVAAAWTLALAVAGCVTPAAAPPASPAGTAPPPTAPQAFGPERQIQLRHAMERRGWGYLVSSTTRVDANTAGADMMVFVEPASVARTGSMVRARLAYVYARPVNRAQSAIHFQQLDCSARTLQLMAADLFTDAELQQRFASTNLAGSVQQVQARSLGEVVLNSICAGRFAGGAAGTGAAVPTPAPAARRASSGSGVAIAAGTVLTNGHVVSQCGNIEVVHLGQRWPATVRRRDDAHDLALLDVPTLPNLPYPAVRRSASIGEAVMVAGYPLSGLLGSDVVVTDGIVNALSGLGNNAWQLQISAPVQPGNSGGPLLDRGGNLVGIVVSKLNALTTMRITGDIPQNINFAIQPDVVGRFLQAEAVPFGQANGAGTLDTKAVAAIARQFTLRVECKP